LQGQKDYTGLGHSSKQHPEGYPESVELLQKARNCTLPNPGVSDLIEEDKAEEQSSEEFEDDLRKDLETDLKILRQVNALWVDIDYDQIDKLFSMLENDGILKKNKLIVFTDFVSSALLAGL